MPALCRPGTAVVVSPLIALMDDQVAAMRQLGVAAGALHSELIRPRKRAHVHRELVEQRLDLLYVSPERLLGNGISRSVASGTGAVRDRRGALRLAMGPRIPAGISRPGAHRANCSPACRGWR